MTESGRDDFRRAVYDLVALIPVGRATTYGAVARAVGFPNRSRMVGRVMGECPESLPAHRVVGAQGILSACGAFGGQLPRLLSDEGIVVENNRICNWKTVFWDPLREM